MRFQTHTEDEHEHDDEHDDEHEHDWGVRDATPKAGD